ncbi:hypothetical protein Q4489_18100 [Thalassotalea sp. 1_MG-2023]|nr:hypothetical protein [Thalassotalea sp. 1_MG-2023]MDO6428915.1 hypothetical protein [Thalassotalea sp. 1_MG-2023]
MKRFILSVNHFNPTDVNGFTNVVVPWMAKNDQVRVLHVFCP